MRVGLYLYYPDCYIITAWKTGKRNSGRGRGGKKQTWKSFRVGFWEFLQLAALCNLVKVSGDIGAAARSWVDLCWVGGNLSSTVVHTTNIYCMLSWLSP